MRLDDTDKTFPFTSYTNIYVIVSFILTFGNNAFRMDYIDRLKNAGAENATIIHPSAYVSTKVSIAEGVLILLHTIVNVDSTIERSYIINLGEIIDYGCVVEESVHICFGAIVNDENRVKALVKIEAII